MFSGSWRGLDPAPPFAPDEVCSFPKPACLSSRCRRADPPGQGPAVWRALWCHPVPSDVTPGRRRPRALAQSGFFPPPGSVRNPSWSRRCLPVQRNALPARPCHGAKRGQNHGIWVLAEFSENTGVPAPDLWILIANPYRSLIDGTKHWTSDTIVPLKRACSGVFGKSRGWCSAVNCSIIIAPSYKNRSLLNNDILLKTRVVLHPTKHKRSRTAFVRSGFFLSVEGGLRAGKGQAVPLVAAKRFHVRRKMLAF